MPPTPVPSAAVNSATPTSRSTFRMLLKTLGATNREADILRQRLLAATDSNTLMSRLRALDAEDPNGARGVEARLVVWFEGIDHAGSMVAPNDLVLDGLTPEIVSRLSAPTTFEAT